MEHMFSTPFAILTSNITDEEIDNLEGCKSVEQWNYIIELIKASRNGRLPNNFREKVILSGLANRVFNIPNSPTT